MVLGMSPLGISMSTIDASDYASNPGSSGDPPYRRGIHPGMYADRLWTMRQYAGFRHPVRLILDLEDFSKMDKQDYQ